MCRKQRERVKKKGGEWGGLLMVWGIQAQNKVAEIHTHKPRRAREATHCGLLVEKWWFESLELRKALDRVWSAPARAVFRISCLSIASCSPDRKVTQNHILIWFSAQHKLLSSVTFIFLYPTARECFLSSRIHHKAHFHAHSPDSFHCTSCNHLYACYYVSHENMCYNQQSQLLPSVFKQDL